MNYLTYKCLLEPQTTSPELVKSDDTVPQNTVYPTTPLNTREQQPLPNTLSFSSSSSGGYPGQYARFRNATSASLQTSSDNYKAKRRNTVPDCKSLKTDSSTSGGVVVYATTLQHQALPSTSEPTPPVAPETTDYTRLELSPVSLGFIRILCQFQVMIATSVTKV